MLFNFIKSNIESLQGGGGCPAAWLGGSVRLVIQGSWVRAALDPLEFSFIGMSLGKTPQRPSLVLEEDMNNVSRRPDMTEILLIAGVKHH